MTENQVFQKIKEMSQRTFNPRAILDTADVAAELRTSQAALIPWFVRLHELKLVNYSKFQPTRIKLTLLGSVVNR